MRVFPKECSLFDVLVKFSCLVFDWIMRIEESLVIREICQTAAVSPRSNQDIFVTRGQFQDGGLYKAIFVFVVFSYGQITKNLRILLSSRKQRGNATIRRFVKPVMFNDRLMFL